jgi:6,7-dimethyl-8-ribityllumazine synthase
MADVKNSTLLQMNTGILSKNACIVIVKTEWNSEVVDELERGCTSALRKHQWSEIRILTVPGAFEIPFAVKSYWESQKYTDIRPIAFIALGCVLRGDTPHFEYVCKGVTEGITHLNLQLPVPTIFGVLTVDNIAQARDRIGGAHGHKGEEAAMTALKMIALTESFSRKNQSDIKA